MHALTLHLAATRCEPLGPVGSMGSRPRGWPGMPRQAASAMAPLASLSRLFRRMLPRPRRRFAGQGMTEYLIVVALIAVAAIGVYSLLGQTLRSQTAGLALELSGQDAASAIGSAKSQASSAQSGAATRKGLENYNDSNR